MISKTAVCSHCFSPSSSTYHWPNPTQAPCSSPSDLQVWNEVIEAREETASCPLPQPDTCNGNPALQEPPAQSASWPRTQRTAKPSGDSSLVNNTAAWITSAHQYSELQLALRLFQTSPWVKERYKILHYHFSLLKQLSVSDGGRNGQGQQMQTLQLEAGQ